MGGQGGGPRLTVGFEGGYGPRAATARATCTVSSGTFGHDLGCIDIPHPTRDWERQDGRCCPDQRGVSTTGIKSAVIAERESGTTWEGTDDSQS